MTSTVLTCLYFLFTLGTFTLSLQVLRPRSVSGALPLAFGAFIGWLSILFNMLSLWRGISPTSVLVGHSLLLAAAWCWLLTTHREKVLCQLARWIVLSKRVITSPVFYCLAPLVIIFFHIAFLVHAPSTFDSLTYHMARVAHWIQQGSVAYFPTNISRQNEMGPGAEYVIFFLQLLSGEDRLAALPQFLSYILLGFGLHHILRLVGCPRPVLPFLVLLGLSAPMAVLQATTTQNDLVCSLTTVVVLISALRLVVGEMRQIRPIDTLLIAVLLAVAYLVKPIALLVVVPVLAICLGWQTLRCFGKTVILPRLFIHGLLFCTSFLSVAGPDIWRKVTHGVQRAEIYPLFSGWDIDRLYNPLRIMGQNLPWPDMTGPMLRHFGFRGELITSNVFVVHQDFVGNPVQLLLLLSCSLATMLLAAFAFKKRQYLLPRLLLALAPLLAWITFGLIVKNQLWITRLQLPLFIIAPLSSVYLLVLLRKIGPLRRVCHLAIGCLALFSLAYSGQAAVHNKTRSLDLEMFWGGRLPRVDTYYANAPLKKEHDFFLTQVADQGCEQVGLLLGEDNADYPLTWRLMGQGKKVRHVFSGKIDSWPCMLYVGRGGREHVPRQGEQWLSAGDYHTFSRNLAWEFTRAPDAGIDSAWADPSEWQAVNALRVEGGDGKVVFTPTGDDPQALLPPLAMAQPAEWVVLKLDLISSRETAVQIFYRNSRHGYSEETSRRFAVCEGDNVLYALLPAAACYERLRLDPGTKAGDRLVLKSLKGRMLFE